MTCTASSFVNVLEAATAVILFATAVVQIRTIRISQRTKQLQHAREVRLRNAELDLADRARKFVRDTTP